MSERQWNDVFVRENLLQLIDEITQMAFSTEVVDHDEATAFEILAEIFCVFFIQFKIPGLAKISEWILEQVRTVDIDNLKGGCSRVYMRDLFNKRLKCLVAVRIIVMPRNLALVNGVRRHVIANPRISEFSVPWRLGIKESQSRNRGTPRRMPARVIRRRFID